MKPLKWLMLIIIAFLLLKGCAYADDYYLPEEAIEKIEYVIASSDTVEYFGFATPEAATTDSVWRILRIHKTGDNWELNYADGDGNYDNKFSDYVDLDYQ